MNSSECLAVIVGLGVYFPYFGEGVPKWSHFVATCSADDTCQFQHHPIFAAVKYLVRLYSCLSTVGVCIRGLIYVKPYKPTSPKGR